MVKVVTPLSAPVPRVVAPSEKVTVPVGVPLPGALALTVSVKVTAWPETDDGVTETTAPCWCDRC